MFYGLNVSIKTNMRFSLPEMSVIPPEALRNPPENLTFDVCGAKPPKKTEKFR